MSVCFEHWHVIQETVSNYGKVQVLSAGDKKLKTHRMHSVATALGDLGHVALGASTVNNRKLVYILAWMVYFLTSVCIRRWIKKNLK